MAFGAIPIRSPIERRRWPEQFPRLASIGLDLESAFDRSEGDTGLMEGERSVLIQVGLVLNKNPSL